MSKEALVHCQKTLCFDGPVQTVKGSRIEVTGLVVHATHDSVWWMHDTADNESGTCRGQEMQSWSFFHTEMLHQSSLGEKVGWKLYTRAETGTDHGGANTTVKTLDTLGAVDALHAIQSIDIVVLCSNR